MASVNGIFGGRFWLNLALVMAGTSWVPIVSLTLTDAGGVERTAQVPVYRCYQALFTEPSLLALAAVMVHITVCFTISYAVARLVARARQET